jgi:hypothetical protein
MVLLMGASTDVDAVYIMLWLCCELGRWGLPTWVVSSYNAAIAAAPV